MRDVILSNNNVSTFQEFVVRLSFCGYPYLAWFLVKPNFIFQAPIALSGFCNC